MNAPAITDSGVRVLGTRIFEIDGDVAGGDTATVVLSDLHVPQDGGAVVAWLAAALAAAGQQRRRVFVLGDLFDSYVTPAQLRVGVWRDVAGAFAAASAAGARIAVLHGNRDFLLGAEWERATGAAVVPGGIRTVLGGRRTLLLHGDELCQADLPYQRAKRWLRRPLLKAIARRLPLSAALWVAARARRRSAMVIARGDPTRFLPTRKALDAALAAGVERVVFGHIHRLARGNIAQGEYLVLPAFDRAGVLWCADGDGERFLGGGGTEAHGVDAPPLPLGR